MHGFELDQLIVIMINSNDDLLYEQISFLLNIEWLGIRL